MGHVSITITTTFPPWSTWSTWGPRAVASHKAPKTHAEIVSYELDYYIVRMNGAQSTSTSTSTSTQRMRMRMSSGVSRIMRTTE